ncbi:phage terminase small subunit-related protein [Terrisporobacter glycolicus]|uniref:phage terminase small subunit-related protein n=1 Tax=Terrisporobacter glycolicus TaxID=36841 RepID=UPI0003748E9C|nr:phage terminase small subunit-related protein [Terrisporobacter glycolicus]
MARVRSPNRDKAYEIYKLNNGEILLKDIATQLDVKYTQVRKWKSQDKWEEKLSILYSNSQLTTDEYNYIMQLLEIYKEEVK